MTIVVLSFLFFSSSCIFRGRPKGDPPAMPDSKKPMPAEILDDIRGSMWVITYECPDISLPSSRLGVRISLRDWDLNGQQEMEAGAEQLSNPYQSYSYDFQSEQPFVDILNHISEHREYFFDYSEYTDEYPGWYKIPSSGEYFILTASNVEIHSEGYEYAIVTEYPEGSEVPDEVAWVFERLRELRDEILTHPE
jgi:hypothetical protein